jgi:polysaccharide biosynthesis transport protein
MAADYELTTNDYLSILKRRWVQILATFMSLMLMAVLAAIFLPPVYQSTGTILIESQRVPTDLVQASVTTAAVERIEVIKQRVMSRENLLHVIQKYNLFPEEIKKGILTPLVEIMRQRITVELLSTDYRDAKSRDKLTIAFKVGFEYSDPELTHKVTNELVTLFLDENKKSRTARATETTTFLTEELNTLKDELEKSENKVASYKQEHANSLPEHMQMHMDMLQRLDADIKEMDRDYKSTQEELRYLDVELTTARASIKGGEADGAVSELDKAKAELERLLILYKETHPTVRAQKRKIETLEKASDDGIAKPAKTDVASDLVIAKIQAQIEAAKVRLDSLVDQKKSSLVKMNQLQAQVKQSPQVERGLFTLMRDYENAKLKYEEVKSKQINAKIAENLEQDNKAERFTVIEPPLFPEKPIRPDKKKIFALGLFGSLAAALGLVALLEMLDKRVRGVEALTAVLNMRPLAIVPYITSQAEIKHKKNLVWYAIGLFIVFTLIVVHFLIKPLDRLI